MISATSTGALKNIRRFLERAANERQVNSICRKALSRCGSEAEDALAQATPVDSGETAQSWGSEVYSGDGKSGVLVTNDNVHDGANVAVLLQYGHGTGTGGYVPGQDYINPAVKPVFQNAADTAWKELTE